MPTRNDILDLEDQGWILRYLPPDQPETARILLLLHGWTGNEQVMWIFTRQLAGHFWLFAPRAPLASPEGGYGWIPHGENGWPHLEDFQEVTGKLMEAVQHWAAKAGVPEQSLAQPIDLMGFSQGAAMSYAVAAFHPNRIGRVAGLAGFLPRTNQNFDLRPAYEGREIYVAHGSKDETVPVSMAQETVQVLKSAGAQVTYCESDVGHKLSAGCLRGVGTFFGVSRPIA